MSKEPKRIQSIERGFALLEALSIHDQPMTLQSITEACSLNKTTAHGLLSTMSALGYVSKVDGGYTLGLRLKELSKPLEQRDEQIRRHFIDLIKSMAQLTNNTAYLAVPSGVKEYLYIDAIERDNPLTIRSPRGRREGLTTSAIGKVFLAFDDDLKRTLRVQGELSAELERELSEVKDNGYALDLEQAEPNLNCLAIPLFWKGKLVAAAGICGAASDLTSSRLIHFAGVFITKAH